MLIAVYFIVKNWIYENVNYMGMDIFNKYMIMDVQHYIVMDIQHYIVMNITAEFVLGCFVDIF